MVQDITPLVTDAEYDRRMQRVPTAFEIFLDMDGVIADFDTHAVGKRDVDGAPLWDTLDFAWWSTMPAFGGMKEFHAALLRFGNVRFLSSPSLSPDCFQGKAAWIQSHFGKWALRDLILCRAQDKCLLARPHHILIDDRESNIAQWVQAGGIGILHTNDLRETLKSVETLVGATSASRVV